MTRHLVFVSLGLALSLALPLASAAEDARPEAPGAASEALGGLSAGDWSSIRAAYEAHRHAIVATDEGHRARNPGQQWRVIFDGRGFAAEPDAGGWSWGLQLERYGFAGHEQVVTDSIAVRAEGSRLWYEWDAALDEWYINDRRGLEHGYTLRRRPADGRGPLLFHLSVRGGLRPDVDADGQGVCFLDGPGEAVVTYAGLKVFDADGETLAARLETRGDGLVLRVDEEGARYPLTIDPIAQQAYLKASNTDALDEFGSAVAVSGDTVVVGATGEASAATGVDGDPTDDSAPLAGAAYVFVRNGTAWSQQAYLKASNTGADDRFGGSVAIEGDTVVIGAAREASQAIGVDGDGSNDSAYRSGAAYVFVREGTTWSQQAYLKASNTGSWDAFGESVAVAGETVVVGAYGEASGATGVNGDPFDGSAGGSGAAYVFVRSGATWSQQAYLKASNTDGQDHFGRAVAISGDTVVVGAYRESSSATGVNGDQTDNSASRSGAVYVFVRDGATWSQQAYLKASNTDAADEFGAKVSVSGDTVLIGAPTEASGSLQDENDDGVWGAGAAYVFVRSGATWSQQAYLKAPSIGSQDYFGDAVAVSGNTAVVGAPGKYGSAGAAFLLVRSAGSWVLQANVTASNLDVGDRFGTSVAVSGDRLAVGAPREDGNAVGVNGDDQVDGATDAGAAYIFDMDVTPWTDLGFAKIGSHGTPVLEGSGALLPGTPGAVELASARPNAPALLVISTSNDPTPALGGKLVPSPASFTLTLATNAGGGLALPWSAWPAGLPAGSRLYMQAIIADPGVLFGAAFSNALEAEIP